MSRVWPVDTPAGIRAATWYAAALLLLSNLPAVAEGVNGVTPEKIVFGQSCALEGPARALGENMRLGIRAAFDSINRSGGVYGRTLELLSLDDGYEPEAAAVNAYELTHAQSVFALVGCVGTPTTRAIRSVTKRTDVPIIGPFTGARSLRVPPTFDVINVRASYAQELELLVTKFVDEYGFSRVACLYQNDAFGLTGLRGLEEALARRALTPVATAAFERNTTAVKSPFLNLRRAMPQAVIMIGTYRPCAEFIGLSKTYGMQDAVYGSVSFVGVDELAQQLGPEHPDCYVSQVVPDPRDPSNASAEGFRVALKNIEPEARPNYVNYEGYLVGRFVALVLQQAGPIVTRQTFIDAAKNLRDEELAGMPLYLSDSDNQASDSVFLCRIHKGIVEDLGRAHHVSP